MPRPASIEYFPAFGNYVGLVPEEDIAPAMEKQLADALALLEPVPEEVGNVRHAPYTWSVKEVVGHITDAERVFAYRLMCIARGETHTLADVAPGTYQLMLVDADGSECEIDAVDVTTNSRIELTSRTLRECTTSH